MSDTVFTVIFLIAIFIGLPILIVLTNDWLRRPSQKKIDEYSKKFIKRLNAPDFDAVEKHFGHKLPPVLKSLYSSNEELNRSNFEVAPSVEADDNHRWQIAYYQPADAEFVKFSWPGIERYFTFADDGCGNGYLVDPSLEDPPVMFHDHETDEISQVCSHFSEFMTWPRFETKD